MTRMILALALLGVTSALHLPGGRLSSRTGSSWSTSESGLAIPRSNVRMSDPEPEIDPRRRNPGENPVSPVRMPMVDSGDGQMDVVSRLLKDRILLLGTQVNDECANVLVAQLLYLASEDPTADITLYINSPGGSVSAGMAIYDAMQYVPCDVSTVCFGMAASMGAFLLGAGQPGKRRSLPNARIMIHQPLGGAQGQAADIEIQALAANARIMIHQPLGGAQGQAADIEIQAKEILFIRSVLNTYISEYTGQPIEKIQEDCDRDFYMTPEEAKAYGIIDEVITTKTSGMPKPKMPNLEDVSSFL
eukprot:CAMPEP_0172652444 /NCGR_PEP_ID=MMETSP1068-20121228/243318_1 /TAXON_ID=35684 /ORGANISM="Pseudopedinella elastica, Strain CCMP716" /LENGTH=303 /DNA_ID=CAMNT_0013466851 /DNA_START=60 /DNA_END=972 /DNA_ORIENTATION=-